MFANTTTSMLNPKNKEQRHMLMSQIKQLVKLCCPPRNRINNINIPITTIYSTPLPFQKWANCQISDGVSLLECPMGINSKKPPCLTDIPGIYNCEPHQAMCSTTPSPICFSKQLQIVMRILQKKDNSLYTKIGIRRYQFIGTLDAVFGEINGNKKN